MSVLEKNSQKFSLDDSTMLHCSVDSANKHKDHIEYLLRIHRGPFSDKSWIVTKRYNDFIVLDGDLKISRIELNLPPKKVFGNMEREFIAERQKGLQEYINQILGHHILANCNSVKVFLDPANYDIQIKENALAQISMTLRSEQKWEVVELILEIGWRIRKVFFGVKHNDFPKRKLVLSWIELGPHKELDDKDCATCIQMIASLQHPYLLPYEYATSNDMCCIVIHPFYERGSLRDIICKCKPKNPYLKKYCSPKSLCLCSLETLKVYGRQILEALAFLHERGIPYGHLHAGNVFVADGSPPRCQLAELENWFLGVPSFLRSFIVQCRKVQTLEQIDVFCFGRLVYEMCTGQPLNEPTCDNVTLNCHPQIRGLIHSILSAEALKTGLPSIADLLSNSIFFDVNLGAFEKPTFKLPSKLREKLKQSKHLFEQKLKEEQKIWHQAKRAAEARDLHMSEEERRTRRRHKLKQLSQQSKSVDTSAPGTGEGTDTQHPGEPALDTQPTAGTAANSTQSTQPDAVPSPPAVPAYPPPPPAPLLVERQSSEPVGKNRERGTLLGSIRSFSKAGLKRTETVDNAAPNL